MRIRNSAENFSHLVIHIFWGVPLLVLILGLGYILLSFTPLNLVDYSHIVIDVQEVEYGDNSVKILTNNGKVHKYMCTPIDNSEKPFTITRENFNDIGFLADSVDYYRLQYSYFGRYIEIESYCSELDPGTFDDYLKQCKNPINKFLCFIADLTDT